MKILRTTPPAALLLSAAALLSACDDSDPKRSSAEDAGADGSELDAAEQQEDAESAADGALDSGDATSAEQRVQLRFRGAVGAHDYGCGQVYAAQGSTRVNVTGQDFRFFVHNVRLIDSAGAEVPVRLEERLPAQNAELALLDFQDPKGTCGPTPTSTEVTGFVPPGSYQGVVFSIGVPLALNHGDPAQARAPLRGSGLSWGWLLGYRFFVGELVMARATDAGIGDAGVGDAGANDASLSDASVSEAGDGDAALADAGLSDAALGDAGPHSDAALADASEVDASPAGGGDHDFEPGLGVLHLGSTGCLGAPASGITCSKQNRPEIRLTGFDPDASTIVADLGALFAEVDLAAGVQCHARGDDCAPMFRALGVDLASGATLATQTMFRVE